MKAMLEEYSAVIVSVLVGTILLGSLATVVAVLTTICDSAIISSM